MSFEVIMTPAGMWVDDDVEEFVCPYCLTKFRERHQCTVSSWERYDDAIKGDEETPTAEKGNA